MCSIRQSLALPTNDFKKAFATMKEALYRRPIPTRAEVLRSQIAQLEARYDSGAVSPAIYALLKKLRAELSRARTKK
jgi:hypothetical protein